jgi:hypothetical protein
MLRFELTLNVNAKCDSLLRGLDTVCFEIDKERIYKSTVLWA